MSFRTRPSTHASSEETLLRYESLLGAGVIEVAWDDEPATRREPAQADRIAADVPVVIRRRAA